MENKTHVGQKLTDGGVGFGSAQRAKYYLRITRRTVSRDSVSGTDYPPDFLLILMVTRRCPLMAGKSRERYDSARSTEIVLNGVESGRLAPQYHLNRDLILTPLCHPTCVYLVCRYRVHSSR